MRLNPSEQQENVLEETSGTLGFKAIEEFTKKCIFTCLSPRIGIFLMIRRFLLHLEEVKNRLKCNVEEEKNTWFTHESLVPLKMVQVSLCERSHNSCFQNYFGYFQVYCITLHESLCWCTHVRHFSKCTSRACAVRITSWLHIKSCPSEKSFWVHLTTKQHFIR